MGLLKLRKLVGGLLLFSHFHQVQEERSLWEPLTEAC